MSLLKGVLSVHAHHEQAHYLRVKCHLVLALSHSEDDASLFLEPPTRSRSCIGSRREDL